MIATSGRAAAEHLEEKTALSLRTIAFAMGNGIALLAAVSIFFYWRSATAAPTLNSLRFINLMTAISMAASVGAILVSELLWKKMLAGAVEADVNAKAQLAFIVRTAVRESAALLGSVTFFLACSDGVLRAYPAYWVDLVPAVLFWSYLYLHWPSLGNLKADVAEALPTA